MSRKSTVKVSKFESFGFDKCGSLIDLDFITFDFILYKTDGFDVSVCSIFGAHTIERFIFSLKSNSKTVFKIGIACIQILFAEWLHVNVPL